MDESGKPVPDAEVQALLPHNEMPNMESITTDPSGRFSIKGDRYQKNPCHARPVLGRSEQNHGNRPADIQPPLRLELSPKRAFTLRGNVRRFGRPADTRGKDKRQHCLDAGIERAGFWTGKLRHRQRRPVRGRESLARFRTYQISVEAEGFAKYESKRIKGQPGPPRILESWR